MDKNWDLLGHEWAVAMLQNHLAKGRVRHAYLFSGPEGVGRRTLALRLAQALNCRQTPNPGQPCGECRDCLLLDRQEHPDLTIIAAEEGGRTIKVDQVREAQHSLNLTPFQARYRTAILLRFENAHPSAANALLKTLEEPPPQVVMMLTAQDPEALLPTIVSRCELVRLRPLPLAQLASGLQAKYGLSEERANLLAHISGGRPGYALRLHQNPEALTNREAWLSDLVALFGTSRVKRFDYAEALAKDKDRLEAQLQIWASFWRDVLLVSSGSAALLTNIDRAEQVNQLARRLSSQSAHQLLQAVERTSVLLELNINTRLAVENLMLRMDGG
jgi:DNA polymerase-3 subunit delta'